MFLADPFFLFCSKLIPYVFSARLPLFTNIVTIQAEGQNIRAHSILQRKREKVNRKYTQPSRQRRQLSPGFLEDALDEVGLSFLSFFAN